MSFTVKNWEISFTDAENFKLKRYDLPFFVFGEIKNDKINVNDGKIKVPKYILEAISKFAPFWAWKIAINGNEITITAPGNEIYTGEYLQNIKITSFNYPNQIPETIKEYVRSYMYFLNKNKAVNLV